MGYWKKHLPPKLYEFLEENRKNLFGKPKLTYSGEGEDLILEKYFGKTQSGYYVDIGCYHPKVGSNTHRFFKRGWSGINIDPNPHTIELFKKHRPKDINLNMGIAGKPGELTFYNFKESAVSTFSEEFYNLRLSQGAVFLNTNKIQTKTLEDVFDEFLPSGQKIDFLDIDTEGTDLEVLASNNWSKYRPEIVLAEDQNLESKNLNDLETVKFLNTHGYVLIAKTISTAIFKRIH